MRSRLEEQLGSLDDALRSSYSEIISLRISKDFVQKAVMDGESEWGIRTADRVALSPVRISSHITLSSSSSSELLASCG